MIAVIGGSGKIGSPIIRNLAENRIATRALTSNTKSADRLQALGATEVVIGDFRKDGDVRRAIQGCTSIFHVVPPFCEDEVEIGYRIIRTAREVGVEHIVFTSVLHPQLREMTHHARKLLVEEAVIESGLEFTIIQPAILMQNIQGVWEKIRSEGTYPVFSSPEKKMRMVDAEDLGEAIAKVLTDDNLRGGTYEMSGPEALTFTEMASVISEELHRSVRIIPLDEKAREAFARTQGWKNYASEAFKKMCDHYDKYGFPGGNHLVFTCILGRSPTDYRSFVKRMIAGNG
jgi:uncharacterized protein YbjT (DUF2867 family)